MPQLSQFALTESPINVAMDEIIATLAGAVDNAGNAVLKSVDRGFPILAPANDECPAIRVWEESVVGIRTSSQFYVRQYLVTLSLFVFLYQEVEDANGNPVDFQAQRNRLMKFIIEALQLPSSDGSSPNGLTPHWELWNFEEPEAGKPSLIHIEHTQAFKKWGVMEPVKPPRYVTRIDLPILVEAKYNTDDKKVTVSDQ